MKRTSLLPWLLWICFVSTAWSQQPSINGPNDWSEFHRANMMRWNYYESVLNVKNVENLGVKWSMSLTRPVQSSPAVTGGVVYIGGEDQSVYALSAATGAILWSYPTG